MPCFKTKVEPVGTLENGEFSSVIGVMEQAASTRGTVRIRSLSFIVKILVDAEKNYKLVLEKLSFG